MQPRDFLELEMAVPSQSHKKIGNNEQKNGVESFHERLKRLATQEIPFERVDETNITAMIKMENTAKTG